jgi:hypothetical protein
MVGQFLYIVHTRECIRLKESTYKIGRSEHCVHQVNQVLPYGKGAFLHLLVPVEDSKAAERKVIKEFRKQFVQKSYYGIEHFEGNLREMQNIMLSIAQYYSPVQNEDYKKTEICDEDIENEITVECKENITVECKENINVECKENSKDKINNNIVNKVQPFGTTPKTYLDFFYETRHPPTPPDCALFSRIDTATIARWAF